MLSMYPCMSPNLSLPPSTLRVLLVVFPFIFYLFSTRSVSSQGTSSSYTSVPSIFFVRVSLILWSWAQEGWEGESQIPKLSTDIQFPINYALRSNGHSSWLLIQRSRVRFPALPGFLRSSRSGSRSTSLVRITKELHERKNNGFLSRKSRLTAVNKRTYYEVMSVWIFTSETNQQIYTKCGTRGKHRTFSRGI
jgi:hypothetical protein